MGLARAHLPPRRGAAAAAGAAGGALLVALHLLAEFGALQMLRFPTFTTAIYDQYQSTFNGAAANMLASVLVLLCWLVLLIELLARGHARIGARSGPAPPAPPAPPPGPVDAAGGARVRT